MSYEGAMLGGYLLPEEQFVDLFTKLLIENRSNIMNRITRIRGQIHSKNIAAAYAAWDRLQNEIFANPTVELLTIVDLDLEKTGAKWTFSSEFEILTKTGRLSLSRLNQMFKAQYQLESWDKHLNGLYTSVSTERLSYDEIMFLWGLKKGTINERLGLTESDLSLTSKMLAEARWGTRDYRYMTIVYAGQGINSRGKIADAFLNHMGKMHSELLGSKVMTNFDINEENSSVMQEENIHEFGFLKLLLESLNNTPWFTGGDLITTDEYGKVLLNIQLKTRDIGSKSRSFSEINYKALDKELGYIHNMFNKKESNEEIAKRFFRMLKTSTVTEAIGDKVRDEGYALAEENLRKNNKIKFTF